MEKNFKIEGFCLFSSLFVIIFSLSFRGKIVVGEGKTEKSPVKFNCVSLERRGGEEKWMGGCFFFWGGGW